MTPFSDRVLGKLSSLLTQVCEKIPEGYENWITTRNLARIKLSTCFNESKHEAVLGDVETFSKSITAVDHVFAALSECGAIQPAHIAKLKNVQSGLRTLRVYCMA